MVVTYEIHTRIEKLSFGETEYSESYDRVEVEAPNDKSEDAILKWANMPKTQINLEFMKRVAKLSNMTIRIVPEEELHLERKLNKLQSHNRNSMSCSAQEVLKWI